MKYHKGDFAEHCSIKWLKKRGSYEALTTFSIVNEYYKRYYKVGRGAFKAICKSTEVVNSLFQPEI